MPGQNKRTLIDVSLATTWIPVARAAMNTSPALFYHQLIRSFRQTATCGDGAPTFMDHPKRLASRCDVPFFNILIHKFSVLTKSIEDPGHMAPVTKKTETHICHNHNE